MTLISNWKRSAVPWYWHHLTAHVFGTIWVNLKVLVPLSYRLHNMMSRCLGQLHLDPLQLLFVRGLLLFRHCFLSMLRLPQWVILYWLSRAMLFLSNSLVAFVLGTNQEFHQLVSLWRAHTCSHDYNARKQWMPNFKAATLLIFF